MNSPGQAPGDRSRLRSSSPASAVARTLLHSIAMVRVPDAASPRRLFLTRVRDPRYARRRIPTVAGVARWRIADDELRPVMCACGNFRCDYIRADEPRLAAREPAARHRSQRSTRGPTTDAANRMMRCGRGLVVALGLIAAGCAPNAPRSPLVMANIPCLPPGVMAEFFAWPVVEFRPITLFADDGKEVEAVWVLYRRQKGAVAVIWARTDLIALDPHPDTDDPYWVDGSLLQDDDTTLRTSPEAPCQWRRHREGV